MKIGIIGCGNISHTYFTKVPLFKDLEVVACADLKHDLAQKAADEYNVKALSVDDLLKDDDIDTVINITIPAAHHEVSCNILNAGKNVYSEKPLALSYAHGEEIKNLADKNNKVAGCAPDTFLGGAHQQAKKIIEAGDIGTITSGSCHVLSAGMEMWHPNPDFFYQTGGGPILDLGPYYITNLVNLIGPIKDVVAMNNTPLEERTITSEPRAGEKIKVETPTTHLAILEFQTGAKVTLSASWDVWAHDHANMELYGTKGSLYVPDPNFFNGELRLTKQNDETKVVENDDHPLHIPNLEHEGMNLANYRTVGLAEMNDAIKNNREPRCSINRALHVLEVLLAILESGAKREFVAIKSTCTSPDYFSTSEVNDLMV